MKHQIMPCHLVSKTPITRMIVPAECKVCKKAEAELDECPECPGPPLPGFLKREKKE